MYHTILYPTDGSEGAQHAADHAITLAGDQGARLLLLSVIDPRRWGETALSSGELAVDDAEDEARDQLDAIRDRAEAAGIDVEMRVVHGVPDETIVDYARQTATDAIVLGARGGSRAPGVGSVARSVAGRAGCPVFTV